MAFAAAGPNPRRAWPAHPNLTGLADGAAPGVAPFPSL